MNRMFDLSAKVALVTGSSRGIGRAIAEEMANAGARVVISSRKLAACEEVAAKLRVAGHQAMAIACNAGRKDDLRRLVDRVVGEWGRIDILVCNAATNPVYGPMAKADDAVFDKIMTINFKGAFWLCNMVLPQMAERGDGAVILISSIAGLRGSPRIGIYGLSKAAEIQLARNLAVEWGEHNIRVNCIAPGLIKTDFARALWSDPKISERVLRGTPLRRIGEPRDIAGVAVFLASEAARYITGQVIIADGGVMAGDVV